MAKELKKKSRRLKRRVRKTLGTICLVSAILVATIPTEGLKRVSADDPTAYSKLPDTEMDDIARKAGSDIPDLSSYSGKIYNSGNGFQFAFVSSKYNSTGQDSNDDKIAVIVGFSENSADLYGTLNNGTLTIPAELDAYLNYTTTDGNGSFAAVSKDGSFLFYEASPRTETPVSGGDPIVTEAVYQPCYYTDFDKWSKFEDDELYYYNTSDSKPATGETPIQVKDTVGDKDNKMRIKNARVRYIGNHYAVLNPKDGNYVIEDATNETNRVFGNISNVTALQVEADLYGIGSYAFYGCGSLRSVKLNSNLAYIGNYTFAGCNNMSKVELDPDAKLAAIGAHAFEDCQALESFTVPHNVTAIGDAAFKGCAGDTTGLQTIDLRGGGNPSLKKIGCDMFVDCGKLTSVTFPGSLEEDVDISNFAGCSSLKYIAVSKKLTKITQERFKNGTSDFGYKKFKNQYNTSVTVNGTFYFEGPTLQDNPSELHKIAAKYGFAFSYLIEGSLEKQGIYELTMNADGSEMEEGDGKARATYRVSGPEYPGGENRLISHQLASGLTEIYIPEHIGPQTIATVGSGVFQDYCTVRKLTIPSTVTKIETDAFSGCHDLKYVQFENPEGLTIDNGAFQTQRVGSGGTHGSTCKGDVEDIVQPALIFISPITGTGGPYEYAMNPENKINVGKQNPTYITFFSGWPDGLKVQYNPETGKNELIDYPTMQDLIEPSSSTLFKIYKELYAGTGSTLPGDYSTAMNQAYNKKLNSESTDSMTDFEREIWDKVINITLPEGITGIREGLFNEKERDGDSLVSYYAGNTGSKEFKTLSAYGLKEVAGDDDPTDDVDSGCFANCITFRAINLYGATESIGDYAFKGCKNLQSASIPNTVTQIGLVPFTGCGQMTDVNFQESEYFTCDNSIIYRLDTAGNKYELIEFLEGRTTDLNTSEVDGLKSIAPEAFARTQVVIVDLSTTSVTRIPARAFDGCSMLMSVILPDSAAAVDEYAFRGCPTLRRMTVPSLHTSFNTNALDVSGENRPNGLTFVCHEGSGAYSYAIANEFAVDTENVGKIPYLVVFYDGVDGSIIWEGYVKQGEDAVPPEPPVHEGYVFDHWNGDYTAIQKDTGITAVYVLEDPEAKKVDVIFYDDDQVTVIEKKRVTIGQVVEPPKDPVKEGYTFIGWIGNLKDPITQPTNFYAKYEAVDGRLVVEFFDHDGTTISRQLVEPGGAPIEPKSPEREGYTFAGWLPSDFTNITENTKIYATYTKNGSGGGSGDDVSGGDTPGGDDPGGDGPGGGSEDPSGGSSKLYTLTVQNGSGSGSYVAGSQPIVIANDPANGYEFSHWTIDPSTVQIASKSLPATVVTMPEGNVTVTAHYKAKTGSSSGGGTVSGNNSNRPNSGSNVLSSGTTVVIDKNGLSNTGVVSATVKGSSDNFTIKVTESSAASEAVVNALKAEYGDISNIKYFPMDISLYDSTGTKKITDTQGLSITITLPLPDSLITYAGNNKVAGVVNGRLDKLSPRFTTIDKVACVTFTAEHFSPYAIYVETDNLYKGEAIDTTPKTGDGIHPKWFLSIGLACVAMVLFMKKDKRVQQKVKVA